MKSAIVLAPKNMEICEVLMPEINDIDEVLIKVKSAGICGSDIHIYHGDNPAATYPRVLGHEIAGEVVRTGDGVTDLEAGDHVVINPVINCGHCYPCSVGRPNVCTTLKVRGVHVNGGFQEYVVIPRKNIHKISKELSWEEAAMMEPFTISAQVTSRAEVTAKDTVLLMGAGPIGLCILQAVKRIGAKCIITDIVETRLETARKLGADLTVNVLKEDLNEIVMKESGGDGVPVVIDAACTPQTLAQAISLAIPAGRVLVLDLSKISAQIPHGDIARKELDVRGSRLSSNKFPTVIEWFDKKEVKPLELVTHTFSFKDIQKAFEQVEKYPNETCKVILKFD